MTRRNNISSPAEMISCIIMVLALLWLTISLPYVYEAQQITKEVVSDQGADNTGNLGNNSTEEKTESGSNSLSEYLHDHNLLTYNSYDLCKGYKAHAHGLYSAYQPELILPPPEA
jgi:hypothetical protein